MTRAPRAVVTGATGYIGRGLVGHLLDGDWRVRALVQPGTEADLPHPERCAAIVGELLDRAAVEECTSGADVVFHVAGVMPHGPGADLQLVNVQGTRVVVQAAASQGVPRLVFTSSAAVYARAPQREWPLDESAPLRRRTAWRTTGPVADFMRSLEDYARSKQQAERIVRSAHQRHGIDGAVVRSTEVYGPWRRWFASFLDRAREDPGSLLRRPGSRTATMQWVHRDDVADLLLRAATVRGHGLLVVNAAGPEVFSELDLARLALPDLALPARAPAPSLKYSTERARRRLGWVPRVPLGDGMREMLSHQRVGL